MINKYLNYIMLKFRIIYIYQTLKSTFRMVLKFRRSLPNSINSWIPLFDVLLDDHFFAKSPSILWSCHTVCIQNIENLYSEKYEVNFQ